MGTQHPDGEGEREGDVGHCQGEESPGESQPRPQPVHGDHEQDARQEVDEQHQDGEEVHTRQPEAGDRVAESNAQGNAQKGGQGGNLDAVEEGESHVGYIKQLPVAVQDPLLREEGGRHAVHLERWLERTDRQIDQGQLQDQNDEQTGKNKKHSIKPAAQVPLVAHFVP